MCVLCSVCMKNIPLLNSYIINRNGLSIFGKDGRAHAFPFLHDYYYIITLYVKKKETVRLSHL